MDLEILTRDVELDERLRSRITRKAASLDKRMKGINTATVELSLNNTRRKEDRFIVGVTLDVAGAPLRTEERSESIMEAVTSAVDAMERQLERLKHKVYRSGQSRRDAQHQAEQPSVEEADDPESPEAG